jgi:P27 family predicted phage terminase small subunit
MRGRKPKSDNVVPMRGEVSGAAAVDRIIRRLQPRGISKELRAEWRRVARILADPTVDRLKPRFVDTIAEYCVVTVRLRSLRAMMPTLQHEIYRVENGRNGTQVRTHPYVAQVNESWRQWRNLVAMLGLSPADERNMIPGQGDLFDDAERYFG